MQPRPPAPGHVDASEYQLLNFCVGCLLFLTLFFFAPPRRCMRRVVNIVFHPQDSRLTAQRESHVFLPDDPAEPHEIGART
jgi:hypothetical protein